MDYINHDQADKNKLDRNIEKQIYKYCDQAMPDKSPCMSCHNLWL